MLPLQGVKGRHAGRAGRQGGTSSQAEAEGSEQLDAGRQWGASSSNKERTCFTTTSTARLPTGKVWSPPLFRFPTHLVDPVGNQPPGDPHKALTRDSVLPCRQMDSGRQMEADGVRQADGERQQGACRQSRPLRGARGKHMHSMHNQSGCGGSSACGRRTPTAQPHRPPHAIGGVPVEASRPSWLAGTAPGNRPPRPTAIATFCASSAAERTKFHSTIACCQPLQQQEGRRGEGVRGW